MSTDIIIKCKQQCKEDRHIIHNLQKNNEDGRNNENIQLATIDHLSCMNACLLRNKDATRGGGKRKKYINKTKSVRYRTRRRVRHRGPRTHMNHHKNPARR
jgi:hypothetical protein